MPPHPGPLGGDKRLENSSVCVITLLRGKLLIPERGGRAQATFFVAAVVVKTHLHPSINTSTRCTPPPPPASRIICSNVVHTPGKTSRRSRDSRPRLAQHDVSSREASERSVLSSSSPGSRGDSHVSQRLLLAGDRDVDTAGAHTGVR
ncbi:hypothetical protein C0Q70_11383 [Pomacea canaliculata]|uniref:Uncharacterized protein n=1 Tax=Pomacea canaliculata TaxID=400727 RepID=A0A2T7P5U9_POMCA|nr:hypothetical protein C0Q70_11383 [Pomacea canaliculata]